MNGSETTFSELKDSDYTQMRRNLLRIKGSDQQKQFLENVRDDTTFLACFSEIPTIGTTDAPLAPHPMTENEFKDPPGDTEQTLYTAWSTLTASTACRSTFWANLTLSHVRRGLIQSIYLAANGGNLPGGAERIDSVLRDKTARGPQRIDSCVRTVFRRLGGLPEVRGNRSVFVDCPFARAWWRERMVAQAGDGDEQRARRVRRIVRIHQTYWEKLVDRIVFRNSTFGSTNIRNALLRALSEFLLSNPDSRLGNSKNFQRLCRRATVYQGSIELSVLSDAELETLMAGVVQDAA